MNILIIIGYPDNKTAYLNLTKEEAVRRFLEAHPTEKETDIDELITIIEFEDEFGVTDAFVI